LLAQPAALLDSVSLFFLKVLGIGAHVFIGNNFGEPHTRLQIRKTGKR
jgi:hypothetical protein